MSEIRNEPSILDDETVNQVRKAIEHRATWMGLMCDEAEKAGADWEGIARRAVRRTGCLHGNRILEVLVDAKGLRAFSEAFLPDLTKKLFEMEVTGLDGKGLDIEFHYCPLVSAWKKLGFDNGRIATLCDIAMDGDRGIASEMGFDFQLGETIAKGGDVCEVTFRKRG